MKKLLEKFNPESFLNANPLTTVERACAITEIIASAEYLSAPSDRQEGGLNHWKYLRQQFPGGISNEWDKLDEKWAERAFEGVHTLRVLHNVVLLLPARSNKTRAWCNTFLAISHLALHPRQFFGTDGSDQLSLLCNSAIALGRIGGSDATRKAASDFIAAQVILSYFISGVVKAPGSMWRNGNALEKIMGTETYGDRDFHKVLYRFPKLGRAITKCTVIAESLMPLSLVNKKLLKLSLFTFGAFHLANAKLMGLGRFVLPFISTYPAIWSLKTGNFTGKER